MLRERERVDYTPREESNVKMEAKIGVKWTQGSECWQPQEAGGGKEQILPSSLQRQRDPANALILTQ